MRQEIIEMWRKNVYIRKTVYSYQEEMRVSEKPKYIYKYKSLPVDSNDQQLEWCLDVIENHRLYFPTPSVLNDPLEGQAALVWPAVAGGSISREEGKLHATQADELNKHRILSLSCSATSPQMWGLYAGNYTGICFVFSTENRAFSKVKPVIYEDTPVRLSEQEATQSGYELDLKRVFMRKQKGWSFEKEFRIVEKSDNSYYKFNECDLCGIIIGHNNKAEYRKARDAVKSLCQQLGYPIWETYTHADDYEIRILPHGFELAGNGVPIERQVELYYTNHPELKRFPG